jgi:hypothetical protein
MDLKHKSLIDEPTILNSEEFNNDSEYVCGMFSDVTDINNNNDFLDLYRYIQYWKLPIPDKLKEYASTPNYSKKSLIENMRLTGEDEYFDEIQNLIESADFVFRTPENDTFCSQLLEDDTIEDKYMKLVEENRPDLVDKLTDEGYSFEDLYFGINRGNAGMKVVKKMLEQGYTASVDIAVWYIENGMGSIVNMCFESGIREFIIGEHPRDYDIFEFYTETHPGLLASEYEELFFSLLDSNVIDVALLVELYKGAKISTKQQKISILGLILKKNNRMLISQFMRLLLDDGVPCYDIYNNIHFVSKSVIGHIIYSLEIVNNKAYDSIMGIADEITQDTQIKHYAGSCDDLTRGDFSCFIDSDHESNSDDEYVPKYTSKYDYHPVYELDEYDNLPIDIEEFKCRFDDVIVE